MAADEKQEQEEIDEILSQDPNAHIVEGDQQMWLLTGKALAVAKAAIGRRDDD